MSDAPENEGPQIAGYTCKGCKFHHAEYWRESDGEGGIDSGTSASCLLLGKNISTYYGTNPPPPEWCPKPRADLAPTDAQARIAELEAALRLIKSRAADLLHCYRHGNGLDGWHSAVDRLDDAVTNATAVLPE